MWITCDHDNNEINVFDTFSELRKKYPSDDEILIVATNDNNECVKVLLASGIDTLELKLTTNKDFENEAKEYYDEFEVTHDELEVSYDDFKVNNYLISKKIYTCEDLVSFELLEIKKY